MRTIERLEARCEVKDVEFGKVHRWRPERVVIECVCGQRPTLTGFVTARDGCGAEHAAILRGELFARPLDDDEVG